VQDSLFDRPFQFGHKQVEGRFVIPSGIRCTHASTIAKTFAEIPSIGVVTTKSICLAPRPGNREPIYARYSPGCYINAVGLSNPGAEAFFRECEGIEIPENKFLLVSVFGGGVEDFTAAAKILAPVADGFELNMSCPHAKGYGAEIGEDSELVAEIVEAIGKLKDVPVMVKVSATLPGLVRTVKRSIEAGAAGITVSNSIGPGIASVGEDPILSNKRGGISGDGIRPLAIRSVEQVRDAIGAGPVVIGMGGLGTAEHVLECQKYGADLFGIGSAVTGMDSTDMREYFAEIQRRLASGTVSIAPPARRDEVDMSYFETKIASRTDIGPQLFKITLENLPQDYAPGELGGKYFFLTVPGVGEKPFAICSAAERSVIVRTVGVFTRYLEGVEPGSKMLLRGPYGAALPRYENHALVMVGGGTGTASLLEIARKFSAKNDLHFCFGARSENEFYDLDLFREIGSVHLATDDGSTGHHGYVTGVLRELLDGELSTQRDRLAFINCGPEPMVEGCLAIQRELVTADRILGSIEYMTSCGVGICGKCASPSGALTCIDGPFLNADEFAPIVPASANAG
jgi:dihydroorotate dehydrogenase electron transfer subunit/dihydroorotate dehydrogenase (NAD+) catalytic subunit